MGAFPALELGAEGRIAFTAGAGHGAHLDARAEAVGRARGRALQPDRCGAGFGDAGQPVDAGVDARRDVSSTVALSSWLPPPSNILATGGTYSFSAVSGATLHGGEIQDMTGPAPLVDHDLRRIDLVHAARPVARSAAGRDADVRGVRAEDPGDQPGQLRARRRARQDHRHLRTTSSPSPTEAPMRAKLCITSPDCWRSSRARAARTHRCRAGLTRRRHRHGPTPNRA